MTDTATRSPIKGGSSNTGSGNFIRETLAEVKARNPEADATLASEGFFKQAAIKGGSSNTGSGNFVREAIKGGSSNTGSGNFRREAVRGGSSNTGSGNF